jgi:hypothetical protein
VIAAGCFALAALMVGGLGAGLMVGSIIGLQGRGGR